MASARSMAMSREERNVRKMLQRRRDEAAALADEIEAAAISDGFMASVRSHGSHHKKRHVDASLPDLIDRCLEDAGQSRPDYSVNRSRFYGDPEAAIRGCVLDNSLEIAVWLRDSSDYMAGEEGRPREFVSTSCRKPVGEGVRLTKDGKLRHTESSKTVVVLQRAPYSDKTPCGFRVVTAYPETSGPETRLTGKDLGPAVKESRSYLEGTAYYRKKLERMAEPETKSGKYAKMAKRRFSYDDADEELDAVLDKYGIDLPNGW